MGIREDIGKRCYEARKRRIEGGYCWREESESVIAGLWLRLVILPGIQSSYD